MKPEVNGVKIIFVDFFDTLVHRTIYPENTKKIWAKDLKHYSSNLYQIRNQIESKLCEANYDKCGALDFNYDDMCSEIHTSMRLSENIYKFSSELKKTELDIEKKVQYINHKLVNELREYKKNSQIKIYCVSDFYFTKDMMWELVKHHGFDDFLDDLFVSAEFRVTKSSGLLYQKVLNQLEIKSNDVLMIGDNLHSDIKMAKQNNIETHHIDSSKHHNFYQNMSQSSSIEKSMDMILKKINGFDKLIFPEVLLSMYLFMDKLFKYSKNEKISNIYFLAREGEFLKKLFDIYMNSNGSDEFKTYYCYVSRKSTFMPSLSHIEDEKFERLFRQYINISTYEFLISCGFSNEKIKDIEAFIPHIDIYKKTEDFSNSVEFATLKNSKQFCEIFNEQNDEQKRNFTNYLASINFFDSTPLLVDVGWKGTIQDNISAMLDEALIKGAYLGLTDFASISAKNKKVGLFFEPNNCFDMARLNSAFNEVRALYEVFLGASHGSTLSYDNTFNPVLDDNSEELDIFQNYIKPIQDEALVVFESLCKHMYGISYNEDEIFQYIGKKYANFVFNPSTKQVDFFVSLKHYENFGVCEYSTFGLNQNIRLKERVFNFYKFIRRPKQYLGGAWWKGAKLKNDGLNLLSPLYYKYRMKKITR
jgi:HAD superfamily hydrolase (TIGR01549 family)